MSRKVLKQFDFRKVTYKPSRKLKGNEFNEQEAAILERMGVLSEDDTPKKTKNTKATVIVEDTSES